MVQPVIVPRAEHTISRRDVDPAALKVLYKLHESGFIAYLVGGSVRDLLLGRRPKDFDVGTSAHPHQVKKLFRNCWIIGRRFRLAHVKFGPKTIEVATFRRQIEPAGLTAEADVATASGDDIVAPDEILAPEAEGGPVSARASRDRLIHRDNTYGTPEEDAFRRDFTVNALFYDIGTFAIIDYVDGLRDLEARLIRCIGNPEVRFLEDPVRMLRAVVLAARLEFEIDAPILEAIAVQRHEIQRSAPARLIEEFYKILRSGHASVAMRQLRDTGLLKEITPEVAAGSRAAWDHITALDAYRARFAAAPESLTNAILAGTLLVPLGLAGARQRYAADPLERRVELGMLPIARRDVERLQQILSLQPRLLDPGPPSRAQRALLHRSAFEEGLTWLEIHGHQPEIVAHWRALQAEVAHAPSPAQHGHHPHTPHAHAADQDAALFRRHRRRRRRGRPRHARTE